MPILSSTRGFKGRAIVNIRPRNGIGRKFQLGNTNSITENTEVERTSRQNFQRSGGGELDVDESITSITVEMVVDDIKPEAIAIGMRGEYERVLSQAITGEKHAAWSRERVSFAYIPDPAVEVTVALDASASWAATTAFAAGAVLLDGSAVYQATVGGTSGSAEPTWPTGNGTVTDGTVTWRHVGAVALVKDTHFAITKQGVEFIAGGDTLFSGDLPLPIAVGYTRNPQYVIQNFVNSGEEFEIEIDGENAADNGAPSIVRYFRAKFSPASGRNRVSSGFASMTLSATLLEDPTRTGLGKSKYMEELMV